MASRLLDYYLVVGYGDSLKPLSGQASTDGYFFKGRVMDRYPTTDFPDCPVPDSICMFCIPDGIRLSSTPEMPIFYTFACTVANGDRLYGTCLRFFETVPHSVLQELGERDDLPAGGAESEARANEETAAALAAVSAGTTPSELVSPSSRRKPGSPVIAPRMPSPSDILYAPKCICLLSHWPFLSSFREYLTALYRLSLTPTPVCIERYICNLMHEVPLPPQGRIEVQCSIGHVQALKFRRPPVNDPIAFTSFPLRLIFERLSVDNLIRVVEMLLLERQVLLLSSHYSVLTVAAEGLLSLLFPFSWQHVYIPFLPQAALDFVHAPMPFLIGTHRSFFKDLSQLPDGVGVIDLDRNTIRMPMNYDEEEACLVTDQVPLLPEKERSKLVEQLHEAVAGVYTAGDKSTMAAFADFDLAFQNAPPPDMDDEEDEETAVPAEFHERNARDAFFRVFVSMLRTYRDYINFPVATNPQPVECFDMSGYLKKQPEQSHEFFRQFCETQAFQRFIEDRMYPSENHSQVLFFDESVVAKLNRSTFTKSRETPFLNDKSFAITKTFVASAADTTGLRPEGYVYQHWPTLDQSLFTPPRYVAPLETETLRSTAINKHKKTASAQGSSGSAGGSSSSSTATVQAASTASSAGGSSSTNSFSSPPGYLSRATAEANTYAIWFMLLDATSKKGVLRPIDLCPVYDIYQRIKVEQLVVDEIVYRSMLDCCGKAGCPDLAFKILEDMQRDRIQPDAQTYASLIAALEVSGHVLPQTKANMPISHLAEQFKQAMIAAGQLAVIQPKINGAAAAVPALPRQLSLTSSFDSVANPQSPSAGAAGADASAEPASSISASSFFDIYVPTGPIAPRKALRMSPLQQNEYYVSLFEHAFPGLSITTSEACSSCNRTHLDNEIRRGWSLDANDYTTACLGCSERFVARFFVRPKGSSDPNAVVICEYLSPLVLKKEVDTILLNKSGDFLASKQFRRTSPACFWNLAWHLSNLGLPLEGILIPALVVPPTTEAAPRPRKLSSDPADKVSASPAASSPKSAAQVPK